MRRRSLLLWLLPLLLSACLPNRPEGPRPGEARALVIHRPLLFPPGSARLFLQAGKVIPRRALDEYSPHCDLEIRALRAPPRTIGPGRFRVIRVQALREEVVQLGELRLARAGLAASDSSTGPADIFRGYHFWLDDPAQRQVMRLTCRGALAEPWQATPPTLAEIRTALGPVAELRLTPRY